MEQIAAVLCVNDRADLVEFMRCCLTLVGFRVKITTNMQEASVILQNSSLDDQVLDIIMGKEEPGRNFAYKEQEDRKSAILIIDCKDCVDRLCRQGVRGEEDAGKGLTHISHIETLARQHISSLKKSSIINFGRLVVDGEADKVYIEGVPISLTDREFALLRLLIEHPHKTFTHEQLFREVWGEYGNRHVVSIYVGRIRKKIEVDPGQPRYLVTVWGVGYRFDGRRR